MDNWYRVATILIASPAKPAASAFAAQLLGSSLKMLHKTKVNFTVYFHKKSLFGFKLYVIIIVNSYQRDIKSITVLDKK